MKKIIAVVFVLLLGVSTNSFASLSDGLVQYYDFDSNFIETISGKQASLVGTPTFSNGVSGSSVSISQGNYLRVNPPFAPGSSSFTIAMDFFISSVDDYYNGNSIKLFSLQAGDWAEGVVLTVSGTTDPKLTFAIQPEAWNDSYSSRIDASIKIGEWNSVACVVNDDLIEIYVGGALVASAPIVHKGSINPTWDMLIGAYEYSSARNGNDKVVSGTSKIDNLRIYNRALNADEARSLYVSNFSEAAISDAALIDDFSDGLGKWSVFGNPTPSIKSISGPDGTMTNVFSTNDDLNWGGFALSKQAFEYLGGLTVSVDAKHANASIADQRKSAIFLNKTNMVDYSTPSGGYSLFVGMTLYGNSYGPELHCYMEAEDGTREDVTLPVSDGDGWHNLKFSIGPDRIVRFYLDGKQIYQSVKRINSYYNGDAAVFIGNRASYYTNILAAPIVSHSVEMARGLYVDGFENILGDVEKENRLLKFVIDNGVNELTLYGMLALTESDWANLKSFIKRATGDCGVRNVGAAVGSSVQFDKIKNYNAAYPDYQINTAVTEYEFWRKEYNFLDYIDLLKYMKNDVGISIATYIGWIRGDKYTSAFTQAAEIVNNCDEIYVHAYVPNPTDAYGYTSDRLDIMSAAKLLGLTNLTSQEKIKFRPIFSAEWYPTECEASSADQETSCFMGDWLKQNSMMKAENIYKDSLSVSNIFDLTGFQWFSYSTVSGIPVTIAIPKAGKYSASDLLVTLATSEDATIYYTTDGSTPTTSSQVYKAPISVIGNVTLKFFAAIDGGVAEAVRVATYNVTPAAQPTAYFESKPGNTYTVLRSEGGRPFTNLETTASTTFTDQSDLRSNTIYRYAVTSDTDPTQTVFMTIHTPLYNGWNIVAVPYESAGINPSKFFASPVSNIYQWTPTGATSEDSNSVLGSYSHVSQLVPGNGYFVKASNNSTLLTYTGDPGPSSATVTLEPGWAMIANPNVKNKTSIGTNWLIDGVPLSEAIEANKIAGGIYWWNGTTYDSWSIMNDNPQIEPWKGYWMLNLDSAPHTLTIQ